jgi:hypothetical protein
VPKNHRNLDRLNRRALEVMSIDALKCHEIESRAHLHAESSIDFDAASIS